MKSRDFVPFAMSMLEAGLPFLVTGTPGAAKTALISLAAERLGYDFIVGHPAIDAPIDYKGVPAEAKPATKTRDAEWDYLPVGGLRKLVNADKPTVFLMDDFGHGSVATQNATCHLIHARHVGDQKLSDHVRICGATNTAEHKAGVNPTLENVKSRWCTIVNLDEDVDYWVGWASTCDHVGLLNRREQFPPVVTAFIAWKRDMLYGFKPLPGLENSNSPRTVHHVAQMIAAGALMEQVAFEAVQGAAGRAWAIEFLAFLKLYAHLPNPADVLKNPDILETMTYDKYEWNERNGRVECVGSSNITERPDVAFAIATSVADMVEPKQMGKFVELMKKFQKPVEVMGMVLVRHRQDDCLETKAFINWAEDNQKFML